MKVLLPTSSEQTISIIPREVGLYFGSDYQERVETNNGSAEGLSCLQDVLDGVNDVDVTITKDGEKVSETISVVNVVENGNFVDVTFASTILEEGFGYFLELTSNGGLLYRDKIYVTSQSDFTIKHKQPQNNYTEYNAVDDNTYIV
jgi:hypothetical protein